MVRACCSLASSASVLRLAALGLAAGRDGAGEPLVPLGAPSKLRVEPVGLSCRPLAHSISNESSGLLSAVRNACTRPSSGQAHASSTSPASRRTASSSLPFVEEGEEGEVAWGGSSLSLERRVVAGEGVRLVRGSRERKERGAVSGEGGGLGGAE